MSKSSKEKVDICSEKFAKHFPFQYKVLNEVRTDPMHKWSKQFVKETEVVEFAFFKAWELSSEQVRMVENTKG